MRLGTGAGEVRFSDHTTRTLYNADVAFHPAKRAWVDVGFSRSPFYPTAKAAAFDLLTEGWHVVGDWRPGPWQLNGWWSKQHYSDSNVSRRQGFELARWFGTSNLAFGTGYRLVHYDFSQDLHHGYFSPDEYWSHMGLAGVNFRVGKAFHSECLAHVGEESISLGSPYRLAWEVTLRNRVELGHWEVGGDYSYFSLAQVTGAFRAKGGRFVIAYRF